MKLRLPGRVPFRLRAFFRGAFLLLTLATLALAVNVLQDEKQRSHLHYAEGLAKNRAQIAARLRHPTGQLALLNPGLVDRPATPLVPLVLPFSAIDFDDKAKAQQAVEMAGCSVQYPDSATLCVGVGNNPYAGGFIYIVGSFAVGALTSHRVGDLDLANADRVTIEVRMRGQTFRWIAPFEVIDDNPPSTDSSGRNASPYASAAGVRGRLTGFVDDGPITPQTRPVRDFRGWLWQDRRCIDAAETEEATCRKRAFMSVRLPVEIFRDALAQKRLVWPPADLDRIVVHVKALPPHDGPPLFDSDTSGATLPFSLADLRTLLLPGETLRVDRLAASGVTAKPQELFRLTGAIDANAADSSPWLDRLIRRLPVDGYDTPLEARETIATPLGRYEIVLTGDVRTVNQGLAAVATRLSWFVGAMLLAVLLTWLAIELRIIRRITLLTKRAAAVSTGVRTPGSLPSIDLADLSGSDELGVLAQGLQDLLRRVEEDVKREHIRASQEKDMWHAVGHEILSPLQSLMALHGAADEYPLEDVVSHVLRNADRCRAPGTPITIALDLATDEARVTIHNVGAPIATGMLDRIFEYGVSDQADSAAAGSRGQGLFVARTYMAKMGGTITAANDDDGVVFTLALQRVAAAASRRA